MDDAPHNADVWHLRHHAKRLLPPIWQQVQDGTYRLLPMLQVTTTRAGRETDSLMMWSAADALVLKWVALTVAPDLPVHPRCQHLRGGAHRSVWTVAEALDSGNWQFVYRTDIRGYYRHIQKAMAWSVWQGVTDNPACLSLIHQFLHYSTEQAGDIHTPLTGIPRGCALSPQTGAILLWHMDRYFSGRHDLFYVRYMDDFLILTRKRWPLRRAIADLNHYLNLEGFTRHPDKTQTGRLSRGFDWCGVQFTAGQPPRISDRSLTKHRERCRRLDEQLRARGLPETEVAARVQAYRTRWEIWAGSMFNTARKGLIMKMRMLWVLVMIPNVVFASIRYPWPIATGVEVTITDATSATYLVTMGTTQIVSDRYEPDVSTRTVLCDNIEPCNRPVLVSYHRHNPRWAGSEPSASVTLLEDITSDINNPWIDTATRLAAKYGHGVINQFHAGSPNGNECVGTTISNSGAALTSYSQWIDGTWNGGSDSAGNCLGTPPAHEWCSLTTPQLLINYNTLTLQNAPGTKKTSTIEVECTAGMKYTLRLREQETIKLSNGMEAKLTANKASLGSSLTGTLGKNPVTIESTLAGTPNKGGTFEGTGVLFVSYP